MPQLRLTPAKAPFAAGCGRATLLALSPLLLITNLTHPTPKALIYATLRLRSLPDAQAQPTPHCTARHSPPPSSDRPSENAVPCTALHLLTSTRPTRAQTNRSTAPANRSIRFTSLRVLSAQSVSAVQRKRTLIGAALRFAPFAQPAGRAGQPTLARTALIPATPDPKSQPTAHSKPSSTCAGRTRFIPPPLREYAPRSSMKRPATAPEGAERCINNPTVS